ncbi:MAG TPA: Spy/CpxP family protein refolding chaperone [Hyphomicrobiaceae bacterium]|jgi:LTXXQ motif family protein|nr:Spy/CpxP family protein refolding chaperone [Hyphomicrobiaceae bacterium]
MKIRARFVAPALLAIAAVPSFVLAQAQTQPSTETRSERQSQRPQLSAQSRARLQDGRFAMIRETLKLNDAQRKLWEPVEAHMRSTFAERQQVREERRQARRQGQEQNTAAAPSLPERLDRASERMAKRAAQMKAFAEVFKPFYDALDEEQKALAGIVLRQAHAGRGHGRRWAMQR